MQLALLATLLFAAVSVQADRFAGHPLNNALLPKRHTHSRRAPAYHLKKSYSGYDFLKLFRFASGSSENNGLVDWVTEEEAWANNLVEVGSDDSVHIRMSAEQHVDLRKAVRLESKETFNGGLFIWDVLHAPSVCGVWPSIWSVSATKSWPEGGEIDLVEYVSRQRINSFSVHTDAGCSMPTSGFTGNFMMSAANANDCNTYTTNGEGCGVRSTKPDTAGAGINNDGGAVYAVEWTDGAMKFWNWKRDDVPGDVKTKSPNPSSWGAPDSLVSGGSCDLFSKFVDQMWVLQSDVCGTWADGIWNYGSSYAGWDDSCQSFTGVNTCADYVQNHGSDFGSAYWAIASFNYYT